MFILTCYLRVNEKDLDGVMLLMALHVDGTEGANRTEVLASSTTDTTILINDGNARRLLILRIHWHHGDGSYRTMAGTVSTRHTIGDRQTVLLYPYSMANLF